MNKLNTTLAFAAGIAAFGAMSVQAHGSGAALVLKASNYNGAGSWTDASGNGNNGTYTGGVTTPTIVTGATANGSSAVDMFGDVGYFNLGTAISQASGYTIFAFVETASDSGNGGGDGRNSLTGSSPSHSGTYGALEYDIYQGKQGALVEETAALGTGSAVLPAGTSGFSSINMTVTTGAGNLNYRLNGAADGSASAGSAFTQPIGMIGNNFGGGEGFDGLIAEIDIYTGVLTSGQISTQEAYLNSEYVTTVPEPSSWVMLAGGLGTLVAVRRFRRS